jgi:hypothetical protein
MGTGFAAEQVPPPGDLLNRGDFIQVNFRTPDEEPAKENLPLESDDADRS